MRIQASQHLHSTCKSRLGSRIVAGSSIAFISLLGLAIPASAIGTTVDLGTAATYSVLGGQAVTNTGPSVLNNGLGVSPGTAISGFPPGITNGATHAADAHALQAQVDLVIAYDSAAAQVPDASISDDIGGLTLLPGVYNASSSIGLTGPLTLNAQGDPDAVFIFQIGSTLTTAPYSSVVLVNEARSCNVFWQIGSSATIDTGTVFVGNILAMTSITVNTGATIDGRALARTGSVTLDSNTFTEGTCAVEPPAEPPAEPPVQNPPQVPPVVPSDGGSAPPAIAHPNGGGGGGGGETRASTESLANTGVSSTVPLATIASFVTLIGLLVAAKAKRRKLNISR